ncbi:hypothetical protein B0H13DRAFT_1873758 [Mycena leptocephala]|nr:hypothetical protein B0H13DRAFT_1873758 [Mycena leptocephala]
MDFVASSQPLQDGEDLSDACWIPSDLGPVESDLADVFSSSQPSEDGEDLFQDVGLQTPSPTTFSSWVTLTGPVTPERSDVNTLTRRTRLVRRVSPGKLSSISRPTSCALPRCRDLVRRVTMTAYTEMRKKHARDEARRVLEKYADLQGPPCICGASIVI